MSVYVLEVSKTTLQEMKHVYNHHLKPSPPQYALFAAKVNQVTITAYQSGKVTFQGTGAEQESARWQGRNTSSSKSPQSKKGAKATTISTLPKDFSTWSVLGSDEVGNGSYFGPVTVCAAYADKEKLPLLRKIGVKDSKALTDPQIRKMAEEIKQLIPYQLLTVTPEKYNEIQPKYNANKMKAVLHNQAIALLLQKITPTKPEGILIDQFTPEATYRNYIAQEKKQVTEKIYFITKGEQYHLAVAAASIICRAAFLEALDEATLEAGFTIPSGAGKNVDLVAARILKKDGLEGLKHYAKLHFANTQKAQKIADSLH